MMGKSYQKADEPKIDMSAIAHTADYWEKYAAAFAHPIEANGLVSRFVTNAAVTGAYAETWIRSMTRSMLGHRFRISTGAVIKPSDARQSLKKVPQCDLIVWDPSELPALFEEDDFALVPYLSVRAVIEIKRRISTKHEDFLRQVETREKLVPTRLALGVVVQHGKNLFQLPVAPNWLEWRKTKPNVTPVTRLLDRHGKPDTNGVLAFIYFLAQIGGHSRTAVGIRSPPY